MAKERINLSPAYKMIGGKLRPALRAETWEKTGVYLVYRPTKQTRNGKRVLVLRYIGFSGYNLYKTIYRHFQRWDDPNQVRITYPKRSTFLRVIFTTPARAIKLEEELQRRLNPKDNPRKPETRAKTQKKYKGLGPAPF